MTTPRKSGRPTKLTPHVQDVICKYIAEGNYISVACQAAGIDDSSLSVWRLRAADEENNGGGIYFNFFVALKKAEADAEALRVSRIKKAGETNWLADMTHLERRHPDRWGRKDRTQIDINQTKVIQITRVTIVKGAEMPQVVEGEARELLTEGSPNSTKDGQESA